MREFKFRTWDKKKKKLFPVHEMEWHKISHKLTKCVGYDEWDKDGYTMNGGANMMYANNHRYILMQYTGKKDFEEVEVYEHDIVQDFVDNVCYLVVWDEDTASYLLAQNKGEWMDFETFEEQAYMGYRVCGNRFENPELLEGEAVAEAEQKTAGSY